MPDDSLMLVVDWCHAASARPRYGGSLPSGENLLHERRWNVSVDAMLVFLKAVGRTKKQASRSRLGEALLGKWLWASLLPATKSQILKSDEFADA